MEHAEIGYFSKTHGVKGQLILRTEADFALDTLKIIFVEVAGAKAPYFISDAKENNIGIILLLEEVDAVEKARHLLGKKVFIDASLVFANEDESDFIGYELTDKYFGRVGLVTSVTDNGPQVILHIDHSGKEVMLPFVDAFIERVDDVAKKIFFNAPEGLIDVYLVDNEEI